MLASLAGIRGYAVLLVLLSHASNYGYNLHSSLVFSGAGRYGVFLFFVLSSFLLTRQFLLWDSAEKPLPELIRHYMFRRALRIFPLYIACLVVYYLVGVFVQPLYIENGTMLLNSIFLLDGPGVFWTIPVEFQYYFLLPFLSLFLLKLESRPLIVFFSAVILVGCWQLMFEPEYKPNLLPFLSIFLMGSYTAYIYQWVERNHASWVQHRGFRRFCGLMSVASFSAFLLLIANFFNLVFGVDVSRGEFHYNFMLWGGLSSVLVLSTLWSDSPLRKLLNSRVMVFWGDVSFSAYLGHMLILKTMLYMELDFGFLTVAVFIGLVALFSAISFHFFEYPMSKVHNVKSLARKPVPRGGG